MNRLKILLGKKRLNFLDRPCDKYNILWSQSAWIYKHCLKSDHKPIAKPKLLWVELHCTTERVTAYPYDRLDRKCATFYAKRNKEITSHED